MCPYLKSVALLGGGVRSEIIILLLRHQEQKAFSSQQCSHPCSRDILSQPPPVYPLGDHSCLTLELYRDHVMKDEEICLHTVTYMHWMYLFYTTTVMLSALCLNIQAHTELLGVEKQGQMSRRDRTWWSHGMCHYLSFTPAAAKNSLSYGYQAGFSEEVFHLLLNQKFLCCWI